MAVRTDIVKHLRYPRVAGTASIDTNILLRVTIDDRGRLVDAVAQGGPADESPYAQAARHAVQRAAPFDPPGHAAIPLTVELPIHFARAR